MSKNPEIAQQIDLEIETKNDTPPISSRVSLSVEGKPQATPEQLIASNRDLYGKPSICQKL